MPSEIISICLCSFASQEWNYHDIKGLCHMLNSGTEYLNEVMMDGLPEYELTTN